MKKPTNGGDRRSPLHDYKRSATPLHDYKRSARPIYDYKRGGDSFDQIHSNAVGNDAYPLMYGSKGSSVSQLQSALNRLGASLVVDGAFGLKTKDALMRMGYGDRVDNQTQMDVILAKSNTSDVLQMSESQLQQLWKKSGSTDTFEEWLKKQQRTAKIGKVTSGLFQVTTEWLKAQQSKKDSTSMEDVAMQNDAAMNQREGTSTIGGIPSWIVYAGGAVVVGGIIFTIIYAVNKNAAAKSTVAAAQPVS